MPAVASLAAAHKGRIKNIRSAVLRETKEEHNPGVVIISFEKEAVAYDREQVLKTGAAGMWVHHQHEDVIKLIDLMVHVHASFDLTFNPQETTWRTTWS